MKLLILCAISVAAVLAEHTRYEGYKVYQVAAKNEKEMELLNAFVTMSDFDFWSKPNYVGAPVVVMVSRTQQNMFTNILNLTKIQFSVLIDDVEATFEAERARQASAPKVAKGRISFTEYHRYDTIQAYISQLAVEYPDILTLEDIGVSLEGRNLTMLKIGTGGNDKPIIFIEGGIHAREWISPALVLYMINQLVENPANRHLLETVDWYIVPVINPDGYEYSHTNERLWRKTRRPGVKCYGVDGNRNFDFRWMEIGASDDECSETYAGPYPFSEPEIAALGDVIVKYGRNIKLFLGMHSHGQYLLYPWGYTSKLPENVDSLNALAHDIDNAIAAVNGTRYKIGSSASILYPVSGGSKDWIRGVVDVGLSYTVELPGGGNHGFDLPASRIVPVVEETWEGIVAAEKYIAEHYGRNI